MPGLDWFTFHRETHMTTTIDHSVPIPPASQGALTRRWPFPELAVGDSFLMPGKSQAAAASLCHWNGQRLGRKFTTRKTPQGVRIWRTA